jgi:hypothetical protein
MEYCSLPKKFQTSRLFPQAEREVLVQLLNDQAAAIQKFVEAVSSYAYPFLKAMAAVGVLSMAVLQTLKDMFPLRNWFQQFFVQRWLQRKSQEASQRWKEWMSREGSPWFDAESQRTDPPAARSLVAGPNWRVAETDLFKLATDGDRDALYDLPIEQLCGQLNSAAQMVLDRPREHADLMLTLASVADPADVARVMFPPKEAKAARPLNEGEGQRRHDSYIDARTRVTHQVQRAIDALQIRVGFRWKFAMQLASIALSGLFAGLGMWMFWKGSQLFLSSFVVAVLGGFLAPVARDLVATLQQLKKN